MSELNRFKKGIISTNRDNEYIDLNSPNYKYVSSDNQKDFTSIIIEDSNQLSESYGQNITFTTGDESNKNIYISRGQINIQLINGNKVYNPNFGKYTECNVKDRFGNNIIIFSDFTIPKGTNILEVKWGGLYADDVLIAKNGISKYEHYYSFIGKNKFENYKSTKSLYKLPNINQGDMLYTYDRCCIRDIVGEFDLFLPLKYENDSYGYYSMFEENGMSNFFATIRFGKFYPFGTSDVHNFEIDAQLLGNSTIILNETWGIKGGSTPYVQYRDSSDVLNDMEADNYLIDGINEIEFNASEYVKINGNTINNGGKSPNISISGYSLIAGRYGNITGDGLTIIRSLGIIS